jgi:hypothetical protein
MEPIAVGFMILVGTAAFIGAVVGAIGGAITWRVGANLALGALLTAGALLLVLVAEGDGRVTWLSAKLTWGAPSMAFTYLAASASGRWFQARTTLRRTGTALAAFAVALSLGLLSLRLFGLSLRAPLLAALGAGVCLILLLIRDRRRPGEG